MKYDDFWKELQAVCPDVDVAMEKKLCDGMVDVFADNYTHGVLKRSEFSWALQSLLSIRLSSSTKTEKKPWVCCASFCTW